MDEKDASEQYDATFGSFTGNNYHIDVVKEALCVSKCSAARVLNIGCGPANVATFFVEAVLPLSAEIVLLEPNESSCISIKETPWYVQNKARVSVICDTLEGAIKSETLSGKRFDMIVCSHVVYYWKLSYMPAIVEYLVDLLSEEGVAVVTHGKQDNALISTYTKFWPSYNQPSAFQHCLDESGRHYHRDVRCVYISAPEPKSLYALVVEHNLIRHPDYGGAMDGPLRAEQRALVEEIADVAIAASSVPNEEGKNSLLSNVVDLYWICRSRDALEKFCPSSVRSY